MSTNDVRPATVQCSQTGEVWRPAGIGAQSTKAQVRGILRSKTKTEHGCDAAANHVGLTVHCSPTTNRTWPNHVGRNALTVLC